MVLQAVYSQNNVTGRNTVTCSLFMKFSLPFDLSYQLVVVYAMFSYVTQYLHAADMTTLLIVDSHHNLCLVKTEMRGHSDVLPANSPFHEQFTDSLVVLII